MSASEKIVSALVRRGHEVTGRPLTRLFDGAGDGEVPLIIDGYGSLVVAHHLPPEDGGPSFPANHYRDTLATLEKVFREHRPDATTFLFKNHPKDPRDLKGRQPERLWGPEAPEHFELHDAGFPFQVRPAGSLFCGLYPDTSFLRQRLLALKPRKVMNTFCFTGSLGIVCAREGLEQEILQVDSSPAALEWAGANWKLSEGRFPATRMRLLCDDCLNFMEREARRIEKGVAKSDLIILDPPSFGRGRNKVFSLRKDAPDLVAAALACLAPGGILVFTCNYRPWPPERMAEIVTEAIRKMGRTVVETELLRPPALPFPSREPLSISVRGVWIRVG